MLKNSLAIGALNLFSMMILSYMAYQNNILEKRMKKYFLFAIWSTVIAISAEIGTFIFMVPHASFRIPHIIFNLIGFSISPFITIFLTFAFCNHRFGTYKWLFAFPMLNLILTFLSPVFGFIFIVSPENIYSRGHLFIMYILSYTINMLVLLKESLLMVKRYQDKNRYTMLLLFLLLFVGTTAQVFAPEIHTTWSCISISITIYYAYFCELSEKHDVLTDLFNRRAYECELQRLDQKTNATIIIFDADDFKKINDNYGHQCGDYSLSAVADLIKEVFFSIGLCYRMGGDEFCVISRITDETVIVSALDTFSEKIKSRSENDDLIPMVSLGYAIYNASDGSINNALRQADRQLYEYKQTNKTQKV